MIARVIIIPPCRLQSAIERVSQQRKLLQGDGDQPNKEGRVEMTSLFKVRPQYHSMSVFF